MFNEVSLFLCILRRVFLLFYASHNYGVRWSDGTTVIAGLHYINFCMLPRSHRASFMEISGWNINAPIFVLLPDVNRSLIISELQFRVVIFSRISSHKFVSVFPPRGIQLSTSDFHKSSTDFLLRKFVLEHYK